MMRESHEIPRVDSVMETCHGSTVGLKAPLKNAADPFH